MKQRKLLCAMLALLTVSSVLASCGESAASGGKTEQQTQNANTEAVTAEPTEQDIRNAIPDDLPEKDYGGYTFTWLASPGEANYYMETATGEMMDDIRYERQTKVEERFNIKIKVERSGDIAQDYKLFMQAVSAGDDAYDCAVLHQITAGPGLITAHALLDWNEVPYIQLEKPWWNQTINKTINIDGKQFYIAGYVTLPTPFCMFVNKKMMDDYDYEDIYTTVLDHRWTLDLLSQMCLDVSLDLNGDGKFTYDADQFGISFNNDNTTLNFMYASDIQSVIIDENGQPVPNVDTPKMQELVDKVRILAHEGNRCILTDYNTQYEQGRDVFKAGRLMIWAMSVDSAASLRDMEIDFGLIPYPLYDEAQTDYHTHVDAWNGMLCIGKTAQDTERTGIIVEAFAAETYKMVMPVYYEKALGDKYLRDETSVQMMDILFDGIIYDFGYIFDNWNGCTWTLPRTLNQKNSVSKYWASIQKKVTKWYDDLYKAVQED